MDQPKSKVTLSTIVPVYSGSDYLGDLVKEIEDLRTRWRDLELNLELSEAIFVLDAPVDSSSETLMALASSRPWMRLVDLSKNYGQHSATVAGILYSSTDWVATLDEDLQHHPLQIESLLTGIFPAGMDVIYAAPGAMVHGGGYRDQLSKLAKFLIAKSSGNRFVRSFNSFRLIRGDIARAAASICAQNTYFDVALTWFTGRIETVSVEISDERYKSRKQSGYSFATLLHHAKRLILTSDFRVLRFTSAISLVTFVVSGLFAIWVIYRRYFSEHPVQVEGWASTMILILAFGSITVFMLGLIAEFLHTSMLQLQGRPAFFVTNRGSDSVLRAQVKQREQH
jgi:glycosyltransferase involved in cell wall biosynthesis